MPQRSLSEGTEHREFAKRVSVEAEVLPRTVRYCYRLHRYGSDEPLSLDLFRELESEYEEEIGSNHQCARRRVLWCCKASSHYLVYLENIMIFFFTSGIKCLFTLRSLCSIMFKVQPRRRVW